MTEPLMPSWLVIPMAVVLVFIVGRHVLAIPGAGFSPSTRRIRTAAGLIMMALIPALAFGLSVTDTNQPKTFVIAWMIALGLTLIMLILALADISNNLRLFVIYQRAARKQAQSALHESVSRRARTRSRNFTRRHQPANDHA